MRAPLIPEFGCRWRSVWPLALTVFLLFSAGCSRGHEGKAISLDATGMSPETIEQLQNYQVTNDEIHQILTAGKAGMTEQGCLKLVRVARTRHRAFAEGDAVAGLLGAGVQENTVLTLVDLDQVTLFAGQAEAMRLAGLSDDVILNVARHRAKGQPVLSGSRLAELRDAGFSNAQLVAELNRGITDKQAEEVLARHKYALSGHRFVRQSGRRR